MSTKVKLLFKYLGGIFLVYLNLFGISGFLLPEQKTKPEYSFFESQVVKVWFLTSRSQQLENVSALREWAYLGWRNEEKGGEAWASRLHPASGPDPAVSKISRLAWPLKQAEWAIKVAGELRSFDEERIKQLSDGDIAYIAKLIAIQNHYGHANLDGSLESRKSAEAFLREDFSRPGSIFRFSRAIDALKVVARSKKAEAVAGILSDRGAPTIGSDQTDADKVERDRHQKERKHLLMGFFGEFLRADHEILSRQEFSSQSLLRLYAFPWGIEENAAMLQQALALWLKESSTAMYPSGGGIQSREQAIEAYQYYQPLDFFDLIEARVNTHSAALFRCGAKTLAEAVVLESQNSERNAAVAQRIVARRLESEKYFIAAQQSLHTRRDQYTTQESAKILSRTIENQVAYSAEGSAILDLRCAAQL
jgi:hypothetical protein